MKPLLFLMAIAAGIFGASALQNSESAIHEIEALIAFLIVAVALGSVAVIQAIESLSKTIGLRLPGVPAVSPDATVAPAADTRPAA